MSHAAEVKSMRLARERSRSERIALHVEDADNFHSGFGHTDFERATFHRDMEASRSRNVAPRECRREAGLRFE